jgi:hypothetical protein
MTLTCPETDTATAATETLSLEGDDGVSLEMVILDIGFSGQEVTEEDSPPLKVFSAEREDEEDASDRVESGGVSILDNKLSFITRLPCLNSVKTKRVQDSMFVTSERTKVNFEIAKSKHTHVTIKCLVFDNLTTNITINDVKLIPCRTETIDGYVCWQNSSRA